MVSAVINIDDHVNRVLNIVKAKYGLKDKSAAINHVVTAYEDAFMEPELRPEFIKKMQDIESRGKFHHYSSFDEFRKKIENA